MAKLQLEKGRLQIEEQERKEKLELEKAIKQQELDARLQMEEKERQERLQIEQKEREDRLAMEERIKTKEIEARVQMEKVKLEKQGSSGASTQSGFDATKNIRLVPKFEEKEVDKYFLHFVKMPKVWNGLKNLRVHYGFSQCSLGKLDKFILPFQLNNVKLMMQLRKQFSRPMSWYPRLTGKNSEVQRKSPTKLTLSLLEFKSNCLIGGLVLSR